MKILIIRLSALGDVIHSLPVLFCLKKFCPDLEISWLVSKKFSDLLLGNPLISSLYTFPDNNLLRDLRQQKFDVILDLQGLIKTSILGKLACPKKFVSLSPARECLAEILYSHKIKSSELLSPDRHVIERSLDILKSFDIDQESLKLLLKETSNTDLFCLPKRILRDELKQKLPETRFIIFAPETAWQSKNWPHWDSLIKNIPEYKIVILGAQKPIESQDINSQVIDLRGQTSLSDLLGIIPRSDLVVGSDSGILHLGAGYGKKTLGIFGPTSPYRTGPWKGNYIWLNLNCSPCHKRKCPLSEQGKLKCLREISHKDVLLKIQEILCV